MTIHIKHVSGGSIVGLALLFHESVADMYRERYAAVPVKTRKHRLPAAVIGALRDKQRSDAREILRAEMLRDLAQY